MYMYIVQAASHVHVNVNVDVHDKVRLLKRTVNLETQLQHSRILVPYPSWLSKVGSCHRLDHRLGQDRNMTPSPHPRVATERGAWHHRDRW